MLDDPRKGTAAAAGAAAGVMVIVSYVFFLLHIDIPAPVVAAATGLLGGLAGLFIHSTAINEDRAALHQFILARLGEHLMQPPGGKTAPARSAAEMLRRAGFPR